MLRPEYHVWCSLNTNRHNQNRSVSLSLVFVSTWDTNKTKKKCNYKAVMTISNNYKFLKNDEYYCDAARPGRRLVAAPITKYSKRVAIVTEMNCTCQMKRKKKYWPSPSHARVHSPLAPLLRHLCLQPHSSCDVLVLSPDRWQGAFTLRRLAKRLSPPSQLADDGSRF